MKLAVICAVYNEAVLLPQFLEYYAPQVDTVFLLDNESTDESVALAARYPNVIVSTYRSGGQFSDVALSDAYNRKRLECAGHYDYVIIVDCDEFVVPANAVDLHAEILAAQPAPETGMAVEFFWTRGWDMWAAKDDGAYDPARSILEQRRTGIFSLMYSKPCIIKPGSLLRYEHGRHDFVGLRESKPQDMTPAKFHLLHYLGFDLDTYARRGLDRATRFAQVNVMMGTSGQYLRKTLEDFQDNFQRHQSSEQLGLVPFRVPPPSSHNRRGLVVGGAKAPAAGWDTADWTLEAQPTYRIDLHAPDWAIEHDLYEEVVVEGGLGELGTFDRTLALRRLWKVMRVGASLRIRHPRPQDRSTWFRDLRADLFKSGFMDVRDVSAVYSDWSTAPAVWVGAFKQAAGGRFGWMPR